MVETALSRTVGGPSPMTPRVVGPQRVSHPTMASSPGPAGSEAQTRAIPLGSGSSLPFESPGCVPRGDREDLVLSVNRLGLSRAQRAPGRTNRTTRLQDVVRYPMGEGRGGTASE